MNEVITQLLAPFKQTSYGNRINVTDPTEDLVLQLRTACPTRRFTLIGNQLSIDIASQPEKEHVFIVDTLYSPSPQQLAAIEKLLGRQSKGFSQKGYRYQIVDNHVHVYNFDQKLIRWCLEHVWCYIQGNVLIFCISCVYDDEGLYY